MAIRPVEKVQNQVPVKHAFISVFNKTGLVELVENLLKFCPGLQIISSGGTYAHLKKELGFTDADKRIIEASEYTGMPETDGGLVKTLHHKFFLGYLTETFNDKHQADLERENAVPIDLAIVDLYPFSAVTADPDCNVEKARGNIDVGGPSALRAAAKNFHRVMTVPRYTPEGYNALIVMLMANNGHTDFYFRFRAMKETFEVLSRYDTEVSKYLSGISFEEAENNYEIM